MDNRKSCIYALTECDGKTVRYIGKADNIQARVRSHARSKSAVGKWIRSTVESGERFRVFVLATINATKQSFHSHDVAIYAAEKALIEWHHLNGRGELLNKSYLPKRSKSFFAWDSENGSLVTADSELTIRLPASVTGLATRNGN